MVAVLMVGGLTDLLKPKWFRKQMGIGENKQKFL